jgi:hypothetical protein
VKSARPALLVVLAVTLAAILPLCDVFHRCGCVAPWSGGDALCNVHHRQGPHCPWCEHYALGGVAGGAIFGGVCLVFWNARRRGQRPLIAAVAALAALPPLALAAGALVWIPTDYPHFLVRNTRERLGLPAGPIHCHAPERP